VVDKRRARRAAVASIPAVGDDEASPLDVTPSSLDDPTAPPFRG